MGRKLYKVAFRVSLVVWIITIVFLGLEGLGLHIAGYELHFTPEELIVLLAAILAGLMAICHDMTH